MNKVIVYQKLFVDGRYLYDTMNLWCGRIEN